MFGHINAEIIPLAKNFYLIKAPNKSRFPFCNTFLLTGQENILIDAGFDSETIMAIDKIKPIDILIISHSHPDHIMKWHYFKDRLVLLPKQTPDEVKDLTLLGQRFMGSIEKGKHWTMVAKSYGIQPLRDPDKQFDNGEVLEFSGFRLRAIHAPGHLSDHYCFFEENSGILLSSDIDFSVFGPFFGQPECAIEPFKASIKKIMALPYQQVVSSHSPPLKNGIAENFKCFLNGFERIRKKIKKLCQQPCTLAEMVTKSPIYRNRMPDKVLQTAFEELMLSKTIEQMLVQGILRQQNDQYLL